MSLTFERWSGLMHEADLLGLTFGENRCDLRNSKVIDIIRERQSYGVEAGVTDPQAEPEEAVQEYGVKPTPFDDLPRADAIVADVAHSEFCSAVRRGHGQGARQGWRVHRREGEFRPGCPACSWSSRLAALKRGYLDRGTSPRDARLVPA